MSLAVGEHAILQKLLRDLAPASFVHLSPIAAQMSLLPQLPQLARRSWLGDEPASASVFLLDGPLPGLPFEVRARAADGHDHLTASLVAVHDTLAGDRASSADQRDRHALRALTSRFVDELTVLKAACSAPLPHELTRPRRPRATSLPRVTPLSMFMLTLLLAANACVNVWRHN